MEKPPQIDPLAEEVLLELAKDPAAGEIVLGGYFALQHYISYRKTHDIDAWWKTRSTPDAHAAIARAMQSVADRHKYRLQNRSFGDTVSFELFDETKKVFSFQIAARSMELEAPQRSNWPPLLIETLQDNIGAKMNALVDRGAPRDFTDIKSVVEHGLMTSGECWTLWSRKNPGESQTAARQKVLLHLANLEKRRPLNSITNPAERNSADQTRQWFRTKFLQ